MDNGKLRVGVIGVGRRGRMPVDGLPKDRTELVAVAETDPDFRGAFRAEFPGVAATDDYRDLLARGDVDAVFVMVRDFLHEEIAVAALEAGKTVFLEKPMAVTIEGCDRILEAVRRTRGRLFVGHNMRYMPMIRKLREILDSGAIGTVEAVWVRHFIGYGSCYFRHWCAERKNSTGLLLQKGAHDLDIIHWLAGGRSARVTAMGKLSVYNRTGNRLGPDEAPDRTVSFTPQCWPPLEVSGLSPRLDVEDHTMTLLQLDNGVQASYSQCFYSPDDERNYTFLGTRGRIENVGDGADGKECAVHVWTRRGRRSRPDIVHAVPSEPDGHGGADPRMLEAFVAFALSGEPGAGDPLAARDAVAAGVMAHESMRNGSVPREVPPAAAGLVDYFRTA